MLFNTCQISRTFSSIYWSFQKIPNFVPNNLKRDILDEMAKNHEQHLSPTDNSNEMINLLSQVQRLLNILSETADFSANIHHPLNRTEQFQGNAEKSPVGSNVGNI